MTPSARTTLTVLIALSAAPACAADGFISIHMANQKIGSAVAEYWGAMSSKEAVPTVDGFMAIHMDNQKIGSAVANFWSSQSGLNSSEVQTAGLPQQSAR